MSTHTTSTNKKIILFAVAAGVLALPFAFHFYAVLGDSMALSYRDGDIVLVEHLSHHIVPLTRGEVIVLHNPHKRSEIVTKRVIGLPLETVSIGERDVRIIHTNGSEEFWGGATLLGGGTTGENILEFTMQLGPNDYFILGDNRPTSLDSRLFGAVQEGDMVGRVLMRVPGVSLKK